MGSQSDDPDGPNYDRVLSNGQPVHQVTLSPFLIAKYEVTQPPWIAAVRQFQIGVPELPCAACPRDDNLPVGSLSWSVCRLWLNAVGLEFPTEAQWEYACRAGKEGPFSGTGNINEMGWQRSNSGAGIHPVGKRRANDFGLYDMHGNVGEWCKDAFNVSNDSFYSTPEATARDPISLDGGQRVTRGGTAISEIQSCRSAARNGHPPLHGGAWIGFRPAFWPLPEEFRDADDSGKLSP